MIVIASWWIYYHYKISSLPLVMIVRITETKWTNAIWKKMVLIDLFSTRLLETFNLFVCLFVCLKKAVSTKYSKTRCACTRELIMWVYSLCIGNRYSHSGIHYLPSYLEHLLTLATFYLWWVEPIWTVYFLSNYLSHIETYKLEEITILLKIKV